MRLRIMRTFLSFLFCLLFSGISFAQETSAPTEDVSLKDATANANNPLANMTAVNIQNYYMGKLAELEGDGNQFWLRVAQPFKLGESRWLARFSLPVNTFPLPGGSETSMGDLNAFAAYLFDVGNPKISFGVGPQVNLPTAIKSELGTGKWSAGFANVLFNATSPKYQYGYLLTWQHSFAGVSSRSTVNAGAFQPFFFYQLQKGLYLRSAPIFVYDFESDGYHVPLGVGIGKVIPKGNAVYNFFIEPQYSVADKGAGWAEWQVFFALNMQFNQP